MCRFAEVVDSGGEHNGEALSLIVGRDNDAKVDGAGVREKWQGWASVSCLCERYFFSESRVSIGSGDHAMSAMYN